VRFLVAQPGPSFSVHDRYVGWVEALRAAGQTVTGFNLDDRLTFYGSVLLETAPGSGMFKHALDGDAATRIAVDGLYSEILRFRPHVLLAISAFFLPAELFDIARAAGVQVVLVCTESPYEDDRQLALAEHCDLVLLDDPTNMEAFQKIAPARYFPQAYRPAVHRPGDLVPDLVCDLGFVGTGFPSRVEFFEGMDLDGLDVLLAGNWQALADDCPLRSFLAHDAQDCVDNENTADLYRSARTGINLYRREASRPDLAAGVAMGPREVEMAACGLFFLRDPRPEGDEVLDMLPTFTGPQDAGEQLRWWLAHDDERAAVAEKARAAVADRTFDYLAAQLLRLLDT
jgi:spore maturation protein CgeB